MKKRHLFQQIYELSPGAHQKKKQVPSLGGVGIGVVFLMTFLLLDLKTPGMWWVLAVFISFWSIGFIDDVLSLKSEKNKGLSAKHKFLLQVISAVALTVSYSMVISPLQVWQLVFYSFLMVGTSNATNLTDGLDGLLAGLAVITSIAFFYAFMFYPNDLGMISFCLMLAYGSFLWVNKYPAKIFMGDTGSLPLGAVFAALSLLVDKPFILIPLGFVFLVETLSVIIQVTWYKLTQKRIFLMAPLHHHFELMGMKETTIVMLFWLLSLFPIFIYLM